MQPLRGRWTSRVQRGGEILATTLRFPASAHQWPGRALPFQARLHQPDRSRNAALKSTHNYLGQSQEIYTQTLFLIAEARACAYANSSGSGLGRVAGAGWEAGDGGGQDDDSPTPFPPLPFHSSSSPGEPKAALALGKSRKCTWVLRARCQRLSLNSQYPSLPLSVISSRPRTPSTLSRLPAQPGPKPTVSSNRPSPGLRNTKSPGVSGEVSASP